MYYYSALITTLAFHVVWFMILCSPVLDFRFGKSFSKIVFIIYLDNNFHTLHNKQNNSNCNQNHIILSC